jgi:alkylation response protein AidB-like acyl-CoA dehydrogenase
MDFELTDEQVALRDAVRKLLGTAYSSIDGRRNATAKDPGYDEAMWQRLAEMGVLGLPFAEDDGGMGAGPAEVALVAEEVGRCLAPEPFVEAVVLAGGLVAAAGTAEQRSALLPGIAEGATLAAFAAHEAGARFGAPPRVRASQQDGSWVLDGVKEPVPNGARADLLVVSADAGGRTALFVVAGDAAGMERAGYPTYDGGRAARVSFASTPATPLGSADDASGVIARVVAQAQVAYCHEAVGAMDTALRMTTEYLNTRKQFGVPLKTFQALTFRAADMYVSLELARSVALWATLVLAEGTADEAAAAASRAKLQVSTAGRHIGQEAIQLHGGIGMTAEYAVGHHTARLTVIDHLLGDGTDHLTALSAHVADYGVLDPLDA